MSSSLKKSKNLFRQIVIKAKSGNIEASTLESLITIAREQQTVAEYASVLRFTLRIARYAGLNSVNITNELASLYALEASKSSQITKQLQFSSWARRYGQEIVTDLIEKEIFEQIDENSSVLEKLEFIADSDVVHVIIPETGTILLRLHNGWKQINCKQRCPRGSTSIVASGAEGKIWKKTSGWKIAASTKTGKEESATNEDAVGITSFDNETVLVAVTDGTGDSQFGERASWLAIDALVRAYSLSGSLPVAVELAAAKIRSDNRIHHIDGACTLVAGLVSKHGLLVVAFGDSFYIIIEENGQVQSSSVDLEQRCILGGEPLGQTITSSGRRVDNLMQVDLGHVVESCTPNRFLFGSDGLLVYNAEESMAWLAEHLIDKKKPNDIVESAISRALTAFQKGIKVDNVTVLVGIKI